MKNGILVIAEQLKGNIADITFEMLGTGRKLADSLGIPLFAAVIGNNVKSLANELSISDKIFVIDDAKLEMADPYVTSDIIKVLYEQKEASLILIGGTNLSSGVGAILSRKMGLKYINFCKGLSAEGNSVTATSQLFGGKIYSEIKLDEPAAIISIYPGSFQQAEGKSTKPANIEVMDFQISDGKCKFNKYIEPEAGDIDITKEKILVSVGRGIENSDNIGMAEELIEILGGAVCASRPVIDQGWMGLSRQVGKSGMTVKPKLYLALGISGAPEHTEGMKDSELIISINKDPAAPIFNISHYGVCADLQDIVPALIEEVKKRK